MLMFFSEIFTRPPLKILNFGDHFGLLIGQQLILYQFQDTHALRAGRSPASFKNWFDLITWGTSLKFEWKLPFYVWIQIWKHWFESDPKREVWSKLGPYKVDVPLTHFCGLYKQHLQWEINNNPIDPTLYVLDLGDLIVSIHNTINPRAVCSGQNWALKCQFRICNNTWFKWERKSGKL